MLNSSPISTSVGAVTLTETSSALKTCGPAAEVLGVALQVSDMDAVLVTSSAIAMGNTTKPATATAAADANAVNLRMLILVGWGMRGVVVLRCRTATVCALEEPKRGISVALAESVTVTPEVSMLSRDEP